LVVRLADRFKWTVPQIMALTLLQVDALTQAMRECDEADAEAREDAARRAGM